MTNKKPAERRGKTKKRVRVKKPRAKNELGNPPDARVALGRPPMEPNGPLGQRIHDLAIQHFGSRSKLAEAAGLVSSRLSETIRGKTTPQMSTLEKIAKACGISLSELLDEATIPDA